MLSRAKQKNREFINLIEKLRSIRAVFSDEIERVEKTFKETKKDITSNYRSGSRGEVEALQEAAKKRDEARNRLSNEAKEAIGNDIEDLQIKNLAEIRVIPNGGNFARLLPFLENNVKVSAYEFEQIAASFAGENYWLDRILAQIAEKNNIEGGFDVGVSAEVKNTILDEIASDFDELLTSYGASGDIGVKDKMILRDSQLFKLSEQYTKGLVELGDKEKADRIVENIYHTSNLMERRAVATSELKDVPASVQNRVLLKLQRDGTLKDLSVFVGGEKAVKIAQNELALQEAAEKTVKNIMSLDVSTMVKAGFVLKNSAENPYIDDVFNDLCATNSQASAMKEVIAAARLADSKNNNTIEIDNLVNMAD